MNERIQELKKQASSYASTKSKEAEEWRWIYEEKFAELIVAECIDAVSDCSVEYCTRPQIVSEIKEHFGVEENNQYSDIISDGGMDPRNPPTNYDTYNDGVIAERNRIINLFMIMHESAKGSHNYWHVATNLIQADAVSNT